MVQLEPVLTANAPTPIPTEPDIVLNPSSHGNTLTSTPNHNWAYTQTAPSAKHRIHIIACVLLVFINYLLVQFDKYVLSYFQPSIIQDLALTAPRYALLTGYSTGVSNALLALPLAFLSDLTSARVWILSFASGWAGLCVLFQGLSRSYAEIYCARLGMGIGQTVVEAISVSLISDMVGWRNSFIASSVFYMGVFLGEAISGQISSAFSHTGRSWRVALRAMGITAIVVAVILRLVLREPKRRENLYQCSHIVVSSAKLYSDEAIPEAGSRGTQSWHLFKSTVTYLMRMHSFGMLVLSTSLRFLGAVVYGYYMPGYVASIYPEEPELLSHYGIIVGVVGCVTVVSGGLLTSYLWPRTKWTPVWLTIIGGVLSGLFVILMVFSRHLAHGDRAYGLSIFYGSMVASYITGEAWLGCMAVFVAMLLPPQTKTFGLAIWNSVQVLIYSSGPEIIGLALRDFSPGTEPYITAMRTGLATVIATAYCLGSVGLLIGLPLISKDLNGDIIQGDIRGSRKLVVLAAVSVLASIVVALFAVSIVFSAK